MPIQFSYKRTGRHMVSRGQTTLEFALLIAVVVGALLAMQVYMRRGVSGKVKESTDQIGEQFDSNSASYNFTRTSASTGVREITLSNGQINTTILSASQGRTGNETSSNRNLTGPSGPNTEDLIY